MMNLADGSIVDLDNLDFNRMDMRTIAHALSLINRFAGNLPIPYSVAQHSVRVHNLVPKSQKLCALLHDVPEFLIGDIPRPVKMRCPDVRRLEDSIWLKIAEAYGVPSEMPEEVIAADHAVLKAEFLAFHPRSQLPAFLKEVEAAPPERAYHHLEARELFLTSFYDLYADGNTADGEANHCRPNHCPYRRSISKGSRGSLPRVSS